MQKFKGRKKMNAFSCFAQSVPLHLSNHNQILKKDLGKTVWVFSDLGFDSLFIF